MKLLHVLLVVLVALSGSAATAATVDMEGYAPQGGTTVENGTTRIFGDFALYVGHGHYTDSADASVGNTRPDNGTDWLSVDSYDAIRLRSVAGTPFSIASFDATELSLNYSGRNDITATGFLAGGGQISQIFYTDLVPRDFETFYFSDLWTGLTSVYFHGGNRIAFDNIVVDLNPVPLPAALPMFGAGLGLFSLFGWWRRRRFVAA